MSSGYRGILRYDQVIRMLPVSTTTEGILLPDFPAGSYHDDLRIIKPISDWIWIDLWDVPPSPLWVEYNNGVFILHVINIPEINTVAIVMNPDELWKLAIDDGTIYLQTPTQLKEDAFKKKLKLLKDYAIELINSVVAIRGIFFGLPQQNAVFIDAVRGVYNTHLTNLLSFTTYEEIIEYNVSAGWPAYS